MHEFTSLGELRSIEFNFTEIKYFGKGGRGEGGREGGGVKFCPRRTHRKSVCPSGGEKFTGVTPLPCNGGCVCKSLNTSER